MNGLALLVVRMFEVERKTVSLFLYYKIQTHNSGDVGGTLGIVEVCIAQLSKIQFMKGEPLRGEQGRRVGVGGGGERSTYPCTCFSKNTTNHMQEQERIRQFFVLFSLLFSG